MLEYITVKISKKEWVVAEQLFSWSSKKWVAKTRGIGTFSEAEKVRSEIETLDEQKYSEVTKSVLFDADEELA